MDIVNDVVQLQRHLRSFGNGYSDALFVTISWSSYISNYLAVLTTWTVPPFSRRVICGQYFLHTSSIALPLKPKALLLANLRTKSAPEGAVFISEVAFDTKKCGKFG